MTPHPFRIYRHVGRLVEIVTVLATNGFGDLVERMGLRKYVEWGSRRLLRRPPPEAYTTAARVRMTFEQLGPSFVKFGQLLSTRPDLLPDELIRELTQLQEKVPPFDPSRSIELIERELGRPVDELFARFERVPMAAGSLAQVHRAVHHNGELLAIKVRRPDILPMIERDLALMAEAAPIIASLPQYAIYDPVGLVRHFTHTIRRELNFRREGRTINEFRRMFRNDATLTLPTVYCDLTTEAVLTMGFVEGCRADNIEGLKALGHDPVEIARNGARIFMKQVFEFGLFHGDPHPGNIRIQKDGSIALLDFGMVGVLSDELREMLVRLLLAIEKHNTAEVSRLVRALGKPARPIDEVLLKADLNEFLDCYYGLPLEEFDIGQMLSDFTKLLAAHTLRWPADLMLLLRALITLDGLGRRLDQSFNLAIELQPFVEKIVRSRYDPRRLASRVIDEVGILMQAAHEVPLSLSRTLHKLSEDDLKVQLEHRGLDKLITEFDRSSNRIVVGLLISSLVVASALLIHSGSTSVWVTLPIFVLSGLLGIWLIIGILRSGRL